MMPVRSMVVALVGATAIGCTGAPDSDGIGEEMAVPAEPQAGAVGANGMSPVDFWASSTQSSLRSLGAGALLGAGGALVATPLLDTAGSREILRYVVRCALGEGTTVTSAGGLQFQGSLGLAEGWTAQGLGTSGQRWVTACLLQELNGLGVHVNIMFEGSHPRLDPRPGQDISDYTVKDATMFGNVFVPGLLKAFACIEPDIGLQCGVDLSLHTLERLCGLSPTCGVTFLGLCGLLCTNDAGGDPSCSTAPLVGVSYPQAIRTKIMDTDLLSLIPGCDLL